VRKNTPKRAAINREADKWRKEFLATISRCEYCGKHGDLCLHEIARGSHRSKAITAPYAILAVHPLVCHEAVGLESVERQLARLYLVDASRLDLVAFNRLRGRSDTAIVFADLSRDIEALLRGGEK
jgi:hypothetical protein